MFADSIIHRRACLVGATCTVDTERAPIASFISSINRRQPSLAYTEKQKTEHLMAWISVAPCGAHRVLREVVYMQGQAVFLWVLGATREGRRLPLGATKPCFYRS